MLQIDHVGTPGTSYETEGPATGPAEETLPAGRIEVAFLADEAYAVHVRGHHLLTDQPVEDGGHDTAATPVELFVTSLASCVAFYAGRYLARHGYSRDGLAVSADFEMAVQPARVGAVHLRVRTPPGLPQERARALHAVAAHCTVHNTLHQPPAVHIDLA